jgi:hypothetical protein
MRKGIDSNLCITLNKYHVPLIPTNHDQTTFNRLKAPSYLDRRNVFERGRTGKLHDTDEFSA